MEGEIEDDVPCSSLVVDSIIRVGTAGLIWGLCIGPYDARKRGLFAGIFSTTRCGVQKFRKKKDWVNASIAGAIAGAAIAARTRSWTQVFGMAALVSALSTAADYSKIS